MSARELLFRAIGCAPTQKGRNWIVTESFELQEVTIHGQRIAYREAGAGPVVLLIHGMAGSATTWKAVMPVLATEFTVVAPDLPGHGDSEKWVGDYSLGAFANMLRDLLVALGHERATVVGQSLGGGIAMQFAYQFPERCERLVLVGSGGLGREVNPLLRALTLPGSEAVLQLACADPIRSAISAVGRFASGVGFRPAPVTAELWRSYSSLGDVEVRHAFLRTLRAVIDTRGQAVSAENRLHLAAEMPTLIVWGDSDPIIPVEHAYAAHDAIAGSRLEIFPGVGHFPHCEAPARFAALLSEFIETTLPAQISVSREHVVGPTAASA
jgi:pimeloyl-ACP methyl ester carboxylesterase